MHQSGVAFFERRRLLILLLGLLMAGTAVWIAVDTADSHGTCRSHHMYRTYDGTHDADGDGVGCETLPEPPSRRQGASIGSSTDSSASGQSDGYDRDNWNYDSASARTALGCDASEHVDHVVALKEAYDSGASGWTNARKSEFANDRANQWCLDSSVNVSKSDHDLAEWSGGTCQQRKHIATVTVAIESSYSLSIDSAEQAAIALALAADCALPQSSTAPHTPTPTTSAEGTQQSEQAAASVDQPEYDFPAGRIAARRLSNGSTEFGWLSQSGEYVLPRARFFPVNARVGRWLNSTPIIVEGREIGRISARRVSSGSIEFSLIPTGGERFLPRGRYFPANVNHSRWLRSTLIDLDG